MKRITTDAENYRGKEQWNPVGKMNGDEKRGREKSWELTKGQLLLRKLVSSPIPTLSMQVCTLYTLVAVAACTNKVRNVVTVHFA